MNPQAIINTLSKLGQELENKNQELEKLGRNRVKAEKEYRIKLAQKIFELKESGYGISLIADLARGDEEVAQYKFDRDLAETLYDTCRSSISSTRDKIDICRSTLTWLRSEMEAK